MDRRGWLAVAWGASLVAAALAANGFVVVTALTDAVQDQSREEAPEAPWFAPLGPQLALLHVALAATVVASASHAWAKTRAKAASPQAPVAPDEPDAPEERIVAPPGFGGAAAVRTRRIGAAQLASWTAAGLLVLGGGLALAVLAMLTLQQTMGMEGRGFKQAVLWSQLLRFGALPLTVLGGGLLAWGWGRWFPLGAAIETPEAQGTSARPLHLKWQRHD